MAVCGTQARNVIVGPARIWMAPCDTAVPTFTANATVVTDLEGDGTWRELGFTQDGVEVAYTPEIGEVQVDQIKDAAVLFNDGITVMVNTNMVEATLQNLMVAWNTPNSAFDAGDDTSDWDDVLSIGVPDSEMDEKSLLIVGRAPRRKFEAAETGVGSPEATVKRERVYYARRVVAVEGSNHSLTRGDATVFPVSFRLLPDAGAPGSEYGTITDRLIEAAPVAP
jgi:hypothetical protein